MAKRRELIRRMRNSTNFSRAPTISSSKSKVKRESLKKEIPQLKTRIRELST
jgi:hypothetical protein